MVITQVPQDTKHTSDCISPTLFLILLGWIIFTSLTRHVVIYFLSIDPGPGTQKLSLLSSLVQFGLLAVPIFPLAAFWRQPRYKAIFISWSFAIHLILLYSINYLLSETSAQAQSVIHITITSLFGIFLLLLQRRGRARLSILDKKVENKVDDEPTQSYEKDSIKWIITLLIAALLIFPWFLWGALGSILDTVLAISFGLVLGFMVAFLLESLLFSTLEKYSTGLLHDILLGSLSTAGTLMIIASSTSFPFGGMQLLLMLSSQL